MAYLVRNDTAEKFLSLMGTDVGRKVSFGDPARFKSIRPFIEGAHIDAERSVDKVRRLTLDKTRTDVAKHAAAKQLADHLHGRLAHARDSIQREKTRMVENAYDTAADTFSRRNHNSFYDVTIINWIAEQSKTAAGMAKLKKELVSDFDVAGVMFNAKAFVLGVRKDHHNRMRMDAIKKYDPASHDVIQEGELVDEFLPRFDKAMKQVHASFYLPALAEKAETHVELD